MKFLFQLCLLVVCNFCYSQETSIDTKPKDSLKPTIQKAQNTPNGGLKKFYKY